MSILEDLFSMAKWVIYFILEANTQQCLFSIVDNGRVKYGHGKGNMQALHGHLSIGATHTMGRGRDEVV
jgi:hypothetical protein